MTDPREAIAVMIRDTEAHIERMRQLIAQAEQILAAAPAPALSRLVKVETLEGAELDLWACRAMGWDVALADTAHGYVCAITPTATDTVPPPEMRASVKFDWAGTILATPGIIELKRPLQDGENWEAWYRTPGADPARATLACMGGPTWPIAVCRAKVAGTYGAEFDPDNQQPPPATGERARFGAPAATQTAPAGPP